MVSEEEFYARRTMKFYDQITGINGTEELRRRAKKHTNVQETSKQSYREEKTKLGPRQRELYAMLSMAKRPMCDAELGKHLGWTNAIVSARRNELMDMGLVKEAGKGVYPPTGKTVICWGINDRKTV